MVGSFLAGRKKASRHILLDEPREVVSGHRKARQGKGNVLPALGSMDGAYLTFLILEFDTFFQLQIFVMMPSICPFKPCAFVCQYSRESTKSTSIKGVLRHWFLFLGFVPISTVLLRDFRPPFFEPVSALPFPIPRT